MKGASVQEDKQDCSRYQLVFSLNHLPKPMEVTRVPPHFIPNNEMGNGERWTFSAGLDLGLGNCVNHGRN